MRAIFSVLIPLLFLTACALPQAARESTPSNGAAVSRQASEQPAWPHETVKYRCEDGTELQAAYLNLDSGESFVALYYDGRLSLMRQWRAASGARYISMDEQVGLRWHTKHDWGVLSFLAADHTAEEITLHTDCKAVKQPE